MCFEMAIGAGAFERMDARVKDDLNAVAAGVVGEEGPGALVEERLGEAIFGDPAADEEFANSEGGTAKAGNFRRAENPAVDGDVPRAVGVLCGCGREEDDVVARADAGTRRRAGEEGGKAFSEGHGAHFRGMRNIIFDASESGKIRLLFATLQFLEN